MPGGRLGDGFSEENTSVLRAGLIFCHPSWLRVLICCWVLVVGFFGAGLVAICYTELCLKRPCSCRGSEGLSDDAALSLGPG